MDFLTQIPRRRETVDCFNCSASCRPCDRSRHRCETCSQVSEMCQGYPRELQWLTGVTSRGKQKGRSLSIKPTSQEWESITPTNHTFVFKPGRPRRTRKQAPKSPKTRTAHKTAARQSSLIEAGGDVQKPHQSSPVETETEPSLLPIANSFQNSASAPVDICDSDPFETIFGGLDLPFIDDPFSVDDSLLSLPVPPHSAWQSSVGEPFSLDIGSPAICPRPISSLPAMAAPQLLAFYDTELCTLPLSFDFHANPFRCKTEGALYLAHAVLAISIQHVSRMNDAPQEEELAQQVVTYKKSATELYTAALQSVPKHSKKSILDSMLVLFALDTLISSAGPWNARLIDAYHKIESIGGINTVVSSPRCRARLGMFVWWDCIIALLSRTESVFPSSYLDAALSCEDDPSWDIHALCGVPKELFQYFGELILLASEKEQVSKMKHARFDTKRVYELEQSIREYAVGELSPQFLADDAADSDEMIHSWHDYYHASNAWKYALLLYIARVLKWDRASDIRPPEITSLSRLLLDSVRSCRSVASLPKQLLFPVFLAGSESMDLYSRKFVKEYCEEWYRNCRYTMFVESLQLLQEIWMQKDMKRNDFSVWWGSVMGANQPRGSTFLFG